MPILRPIKTACHLQQLFMGNYFYIKPYKVKLMGLLEAQKKEIKELKKLVYSKMKKLTKLKNMIKNIAKMFCLQKIH